MSPEKDGMKTIMLDEIKEIQKTLAKDDVSNKDLAKALSFFIRVNMPAIKSDFITELENEERLKQFRKECPVHKEYQAQQEALNSIPLFKLFKIVRKQLGWLFGMIVLIVVWLQRNGLIHIGK